MVREANGNLRLLFAYAIFYDWVEIVNRDQNEEAPNQNLPFSDPRQFPGYNAS
jgi:hypothetical protein